MVKDGRKSFNKMLANLAQFKAENLQRKNQALKNDWAAVKPRKIQIRRNIQSIIHLCQEFAQLDNNRQENELIDYIILISNRHLDESNSSINLDFTENLYRTIID